MEERNKYLTEAMGDCWHKWGMPDRFTVHCTKCKMNIGRNMNMPTKNNFSSWEGFGKLFGWASKQDWWEEPHNDYYEVLPDKYIDPDKFANAIYRFLKYEEMSSESSNISG